MKKIVHSSYKYLFFNKKLHTRKYSQLIIFLSLVLIQTPGKYITALFT